MGWNSQLTANVSTAPQKLTEAHHRGWLAGTAMRLACPPVARNPYDKDSEEWLYWEMGFEKGMAG